MGGREFMETDKIVIGAKSHYKSKTFLMAILTHLATVLN
jgi:hypothetical protein